MVLGMVEEHRNARFFAMLGRRGVYNGSNFVLCPAVEIKGASLHIISYYYNSIFNFQKVSFSL
jgi:hypothetical protein